MVQEQAVILNKLSRFHDSARQLFPIKKMFLYSSYAKGIATENSDIDVAVVIDETDHSKRFDITAKLFHAASDIDVTIEPKCIFWDEYERPDEASILSEIISTGIELV